MYVYVCMCVWMIMFARMDVSCMYVCMYVHIHLRVFNSGLTQMMNHEIAHISAAHAQQAAKQRTVTPVTQGARHTEHSGT